MNIWKAPDRTQYPTEYQTANELEALTGADMCISPFPLEPNDITLNSHIKQGALFVQIKIGYDLLNFDGIKNFCARVQACKIPKSQAILLRIGDYWRDDNNLLRLKGNKPYSDNTTWNNYRRMLMATELRGVTVFPECLSSVDELPNWIDDVYSIVAKLTKEGDRELWPEKIVPNFNPDDIFQVLKPVQPNDPRYIMVAGLKGYGEKRANSTAEYIINELNIPGIKIDFEDGQTEYEIPLYYFWKVLTDENEKGKAVHNVSGWGDKSRKDFRRIIGLKDGQNLSVTGEFDTYLNGWRTYGEHFRKQIEARGAKEAGQIWDEMMRMANELENE